MQKRKKVTLSDWIISISAAGVSICLAIAGYFANMWFSGVDSKFENSDKKIDKLSQNIEKLETKVQAQIMEIPTRVGRSLESKDKEHTRHLADRLVESTHKIQRLEIILREKIFPQLCKIDDINGKVVVLDLTVQRFVEGLQKLRPK